MSRPITPKSLSIRRLNVGQFSFQKLKKQFFAVSCLLTLFAVLSVNIPAQKLNQSTYTSTASSQTVFIGGILDFFNFLDFSSIFGKQEVERRLPSASPALESDVDPTRYVSEPPTVALASSCSSTGVTINISPAPFPATPIQTAINNANPAGGDKIKLAAGTYTEQIVVNKCVTIEGSGQGTTFIKSPDPLAASTVSGVTWRSIVEVRSNSYVTMTDLTVTGPLPFTTQVYGVFVGESATLKMKDAKVTAIHKTSGIDGAQNGTAVLAGSVGANQIGAIDFDNVTIDDYQKNGVIVTRSGSNAIIANSTVSGIGPTSIIAQNGIQIGKDTTAALTGNTVSGHQYTPLTVVAVGILPFDSGNLTASGNTLNGNDVGIYSINSTVPVTLPTLDISGNTLTNNLYGIIFESTTATVTNNFITGSNLGILGTPVNGQTVKVNANSVTAPTGANSVGIAFDNFDSGNPTSTAVIDAHFNHIFGHSVGLENDSSSMTNAENNFWGCNAGPQSASGNGCDTISALVNAAPYLKLTGISATPTSVNTGDPSTVSGTNLRMNSAGADTYALTGNPHVPDGIVVNYTAAFGTVSPGSTTIVNGSAVGSTTFTGGGPYSGDQLGGVTATVDNATDTAAITVNDTRKPMVTINQKVGQPDPANGVPVEFTAVFDEEVTDFTGADVTITGVTFSSVVVTDSGDHKTFNIAVTPTSNGVVTANIPAGVPATTMGAFDPAGNPNEAAIPGDNTVTFFLGAIELVVEPTGANCLGNGAPVHMTIQGAVAAASPGYIIRVCSGTYSAGLTGGEISINKPLTVIAAEATKPIIQVDGSGPTNDGFDVTATGVTLENLEIVKIGTGDQHHMVRVEANDFTGRGNYIHGPSWQTPNHVSRAYVFNAGLTGWLIDTNTVEDLRQIAYTTGGSGTASNNTWTGTKGWANDGSLVTFTNNTMTTCAKCDTDIALFNNADPAYQAFYADRLALSNANNNAHIDVQFTAANDSGRAISYVATTGSSTNDGRVATPYASIQQAIFNPASGIVDGTLPGGIVNVAAGTYNEDVNLSRSLTLRGPNVGISPNTGTRVAEAILVAQPTSSFRNITANTPNTTFVVDGLSFTAGSALHDGNQIGAQTINGIFRNNIVQNASIIFIGSSSEYQSLTVTNNRFSNITSTPNASAMQFNSGGTMTVTNNVIDTTGFAGILFDSITTAVADGNTISNTQAQAIQVGPNMGNTQVTNNRINSANIINGADRGGIRLYGTSVTGPVSVSCNTITNSYNGIAVKNGEVVPANMTVNNNNFVGNSNFGVYNGGTGTLNAQSNYWGAANGPGPVGPGSGDKVSTNVDFSGFLGSPATGCAAPSPTFPTVTINKAGSQSDPATSSPINFTVVFSEAVTGFDGSDLDFSGSTTGGTLVGTVTGGSTTYNVAVSGMSHSGLVIAKVKVGAAQSLATSNPSAASTSTGNSVQFNIVPNKVFVTPNAPQGWYYYDDITNMLITGYDFVYGPSTPPLPYGSARIQTDDVGKKALATQAYGGTRLDQITSINYGAYTNTPGNPAKAPSFQFDVDYDLNDNTNINYQGRLTYEPYLNGTVTQQMWMNQDATGGTFWATKTSVNGSNGKCPQPSPCTRAQLLAFFPNVGVHTGGQLLFKGEGSGGGVGFDGNVDAFTIGINSSNTTFDFEPAPVPTVSYMGADPTSASTLNFKVVFTEPVTGFTDSDVTLGGTANPTTAVVTEISPPGDGTTYNIAVTGMSGMGTVTVSVTGAAAQSMNSGATSVASNTVTVNFDNSAPTVTVIQAAGQADPTSTSPINFTVVFSEPVTGFGNAASDVTIGGTAFGAFNLKNAVVTQVSPPGDGTTYNVAVSGMNASGTVTISIPAAAAQDNVSNDNAASVPGTFDDTVTFTMPAETPITVNPTNTGVAPPTPGTITSWWGYNDVTNSFTPPSYVTGPATPPLGTGSASLNTTATGQYLFFSTYFNNTPLSQITELSYSSYAVDASNQNNLPTLQIGIDYDSADANTGFQGRLVFEPVNNQTSPNQAPAATPMWERWNATNGKYWFTQGPGTAACGAATPCSLASILATYPNINIPNTAFGFIGFRSTGGGANAVENYVDKFTIGVNSANTTFNFEATPPTISINSVTANEGDSGNTPFTFTITQSAATTLATTVNVSTMDGSAMTADNDYTALTNFPVTIPAGQMTATVTVNVKGDVIFEPTENFTVKLSNAVNAEIATGTGTGTITNDDTCVYTLSPTFANVAYTGGSGSFGVTVLTGCTYTAVSNDPFITVTGGTPGNGNGTINYTVASNAASPTYNGAARTGTITVGGQTFTVNQAAAPMNVVIASGLTGLNNTTLTVPVDVTTLTTGRNIASFDFNVSYDPAVLMPTMTPYDTTGTILPNDALVVPNVVSPGNLSFSVTSSDLSGVGTLLNLKFKIIGVAPACSPLNFMAAGVQPAFIFNNGNPAVTTMNGSACVLSGTVNGRVFYGNDGTLSNVGVPNATLTGVATTIGQPTVTAMSVAPTGNYSLSGFGSGAYTVTPTKPMVVQNNMTNPNNPILSFDASQIQKYKVGLITLTPKQLEAADVDGNGTVQSFDAALIQQYKAQIPPAFGVNNTGKWKFNPLSRGYSDTDLDTNQSGQDYEAILLGDVDGSYANAPTIAPDGDDDELTSQKSSNSSKQIQADIALAGVQIVLPVNSYGTSVPFTIPVNVSDLTGLNVTSYDFDIVYDPTVIQPVMNSADNSGTLSSGLSVISNVTGTGRLTVSAAGVNSLTGAGTLLNLKFKTIGATGAVSTLSFSPFIFNGGTPMNMSTPGTITILGPSATGVSISGKVQSTKGRGVANTQITMTDSRGEMRTTRSNPYGYFRFTDVPAGEAYTVNIRSKQYTFTTQVVNVSQNLDNLIFTADK